MDILFIGRSEGINQVMPARIQESLSIEIHTLHQVGVEGGAGEMAQQ